MIVLVKPPMHVAAPIRDSVHVEVARDFELLAAPGIAAGPRRNPAVRVDAALLDRAGPKLRIAPW